MVGAVLRPVVRARRRPVGGGAVRERGAAARCSEERSWKGVAVARRKRFGRGPVCLSSGRGLQGGLARHGPSEEKGEEEDGGAPFACPSRSSAVKGIPAGRKLEKPTTRSPYAFFPGDTGTMYQDFTLPLSLVVEAAIEREGEKGRREGKRSLEVALNEFELIHRSERPEDLEEAAKQRFKLCRDEFGSCGCSQKVEALAAERARLLTTLSTRRGVLNDGVRDDAVDATAPAGARTNGPRTATTASRKTKRNRSAV